jgi:RimJ/RimL family protein N-acetyltransferase
MTWTLPVTLRGARVTLEPLALHHEEALAAAVADGELWRLWYTRIPRPEAMRAEIDRRLGLAASGSMCPFTVVDARSGRVVGMTSYLHVEPEHRRLEIGGTWYAKGAQRTGLNTECKRLLLAHAFDELRCIAVELRTHFFNHPSRRAIERLGAKLDGVLRHHQRMPDGTLRDTCVYSIVAAEWPSVRTHLDRLLEAGA